VLLRVFPLDYDHEHRVAEHEHEFLSRTISKTGRLLMRVTPNCPMKRREKFLKTFGFSPNDIHQLSTSHATFAERKATIENVRRY